MIDDKTPYGVIDTQTGQVVYKTIWAKRSAARRYADKKDLEYGAARYSPRVLAA